MVILHIATITTDMFCGVNVVVPQHVIAQSAFATVGFINVNNISIVGINNQIEYVNNFDIRKLPKPFDRPNIVVFHEVYRIDYLRIAFNLRKNDIPYVVIPHGELHSKAQKRKVIKKKIANFLFFDKFINKASAIQCLSIMEMNNTKFGKNKFIGTNGIDIPSAYKIKFSESEVKFVYVGRIDIDTKGLDLMLSAIYKEANFLRNNNCIFDLYGPSTRDGLANLNKIIDLFGIGDIVFVHGVILGDEKEKVILKSDIFIQTSRHEGMPLGILEAMSYGVPCIITEGTVLAKEIAANSAGWNAGTCVNEIASAIKESVCSKSLWKEYGSNAREFVMNYHSWEKVAGETIDTYKTLLYGADK